MGSQSSHVTQRGNAGSMTSWCTYRLPSPPSSMPCSSYTQTCHRSLDWVVTRISDRLLRKPAASSYIRCKRRLTRCTNQWRPEKQCALGGRGWRLCALAGHQAATLNSATSHQCAANQELVCTCLMHHSFQLLVHNRIQVLVDRKSLKHRLLRKLQPCHPVPYIHVLKLMQGQVNYAAGCSCTSGVECAYQWAASI